MDDDRQLAQQTRVLVLPAGETRGRRHLELQGAQQDGGAGLRPGTERVIVTPWSDILSNVLVTKKSNLHGANLEGVNLEGDNLPDANLQGANLQNANLQKANLEGANLNKANLTGANLDGANTKGANLNKITWSNTICPDGSNSNSDGGTCVNNLS